MGGKSGGLGGRGSPNSVFLPRRRGEKRRREEKEKETKKKRKVAYPGPTWGGLVENIEVVGVDHLIGDPQLLVHPGDHHLLVDGLVGPADEVAVQVHIQVVQMSFTEGRGW